MKLESFSVATGHQDLQNPYAFVIGLDCMTGLQTARILARHGVPVIGIAADAKHPCCHTRVCNRVLTADVASEDLIRLLEGFAPQLNQKAVLYPCTDMSVLLISRHRRRLEASYRVILPEVDIVELLMDKVSFYTYAQKQGFPIPRTCFLHDRADAERAAERLRYPCILKPPLKTPKWEQHTKAKVFKVFSSQEFLTLYDRCAEWTGLLMGQEWIEGPDSALYSCNCYFSADSEPLVTFVARKLRQWPPETGTSCLGQECRNDTVLEETVRLFKMVRLHGLGYVEMKRDGRNGEHFLIEPNIGRPTGRSAIAEAGGVELLYTKYCDAVGRPLPQNRNQKYLGVKWIYLRRDCQSAWHYWRQGELTLGQWWKSLRGRKGYALLSWRDPLPFIYDLAHAFGRLGVRGTASGRRKALQAKFLGPKGASSESLPSVGRGVRG